MSASSNDRRDQDGLTLRFVMSAADVEDLPRTNAEVALMGRSNVGKSSLLNALARQKNLAHTSGTPGRTQLLNCFEFREGRTLIDLPGYGYAKAPKATRQAWERRMRRYLVDRPGLTRALLLVDGEVGPTKLDLEMLTWLRSNEVPFEIVATKHDKVKSSKRDRRRREFAEACAVDSREVLWVSVRSNVNIDRLRARVRELLGV